MRFRVIDRMLAALSGLLILLFGVVLCAFGAGVFQNLNWTLPQGPANLTQRVVIIAIALLLCLLGLHGLWMLFRRRADKGFIVQRTDMGDMCIAMSALSSMVNKCVDQHPEVSVKKTRIHRIRDGVIVDLKILLGNGSNIPLTVNVLQKQIKQYITSCSGVDVHEVRVQVGTSDLPVQETAEQPAIVAEQAPAMLMQEEPGVEVAADNIFRHTEEPADYVEPVEYAEPVTETVVEETPVVEEPTLVESYEEVVVSEAPVYAAAEEEISEEYAAEEKVEADMQEACAADEMTEEVTAAQEEIPAAEEMVEAPFEVAAETVETIETIESQEADENASVQE